MWYRFDSAINGEAALTVEDLPHEYYVTLFMYAELYEMISADNFSNQLFAAIVAYPQLEKRRYATATKRKFSVSDYGPLDVSTNSNNWRNVALWYSRQ